MLAMERGGGYIMGDFSCGKGLYSEREGKILGALHLVVKRGIFCRVRSRFEEFRIYM